jgi:hypothetical protein
MKIISYKEASENSNLKYFSNELWVTEELHENPDFIKDFGVKKNHRGDFDYDNTKAMEDGLCSFRDEIRYILQAINGKQNLRGKTILDLGCGTIKNRSGFESWGSDYGKYGFDPWLCRLLPYLGVKTIGIDIDNLDNEKFEHYSLNLLEPNSLSFLQDNSIDIAHTRWFFNSPTLMKMVYEEKFNQFDENNYEQYKKAKEKLMNLLVPQLERIVKPEGLFIYG